VARLAVALTYDIVLGGDAELASSMRARLDRELGSRMDDGLKYKSSATVTQSNHTIHVRLHYSAAVDERRPASAAWRLRDCGTALERIAENAFSSWGHRVPAYVALYDLGREGARVTPQVEVHVPLLAVDDLAVQNDIAASRVLAASIREFHDFSSDQRERIAASQVHLEAGSLVITTPGVSAALDCAEAYLTAERRKARPWESLPPTPLWAWASAAVALLSFGLSWAPLTWATLAALATVSAVVAVLAAALARRMLARRSVTAWGMAPILVLIGFACVYGGISLLDGDAITLNGSELHHLREPLLLSLSLLTTGGFLDVQVHQWVRSLAYLEMLLVAAMAGGAAVVAARRISRRVGQIVDELGRDREARG
jgi:hypothetical protein